MYVFVEFAILCRQLAQELTPSKRRRRVSSRVLWHLVWRGGALGRMDVHSQEDLLADAAREGEAPKLRHLLRNAAGAL